VSRSFSLIIVFAFVAAACAPTGLAIGPERPAPSSTTTIPREVAPLEGLSLEAVAQGLSNPVALAAAPGITDTFIVERTGTIVTASSAGSTTVLDIADKVTTERNEQGLLGFAVHPDFPSDPRGFAIYTDLEGDVIVASFTWTGSEFDPASERPVLTVPQPHFYHQGGGITFGPRGYLWMSFGDGGGIGDRYENGQNPSTLMGSIVRIDVDNADPYAFPPTNPFLDGGGAPEVWAFGLRNPWRITIDGDTLIIADVGQDAAEEINVVSVDEPGLNFGWPVMEGYDCYESKSCDDAGMTPPTKVLERKRICALIGGPVYRGSAIPELYGQYVYGDFCVGWVRSAPIVDGTLGEVTDWEATLGNFGMITSFGLDEDGELLVATFEGDVFRIVPDRDA
jgi:glucose/arabinose dehydrogenase